MLASTITSDVHSSSELPWRQLREAVFALDTSEADNCDTSLPILPLDSCDVEYIYGGDEEPINAACEAILRSRPQNSKVPIGMDIEWPSVNNVAQTASLLQLCVRDLSRTTPERAVYKAYLIQLTDLAQSPYSRRLPDSIINLFNDSRTLMIGIGIGKDIHKLAADYGYLLTRRGIGKHTNKYVDLSAMAKWAIDLSYVRGLGPLLEETCKYRLNKERTHPRISDWSASPLDERQREYAARDALAGLLIYEHLRIANRHRLYDLDRTKKDQPYLRPNPTPPQRPYYRYR